MPRIVHDGAAQHGRLAPELMEQIGARELFDLLRRYFDDALEGGWEEYGPQAESVILGQEAWFGELEWALFGPIGDPAARETWPVIRINDFRARVAGEVRARAGTPPGQDPPPPRRVFVSHRQADHAEAQGLARAILLHGRFDVWLDLWDPLLPLVARSTLPPARQALLTALIIEMGLMNARAVLALITANAKGSAWIPYEYGRVKRGGPFAESAASAISGAALPDAEVEAFRLAVLDGSALPPLPEYMRLGPVLPWDEIRVPPDPLRAWLDQL